ncbi:alpha-E domain-containing protein [Granulicella arctica]|uniref:Putative alpha-E superfamily protein n=1 Tax=Granulicella arctica TaxID=940613 RepID=A0A7Y9PFZ6_9BACT|nr:alpha-E domain-containing protein [Granulicella arctica]NYF79127.1 putative alpha-E superfamily protein [Granulicella arctica]
MLSRVADSLYWMSRYLERAEHTTRLLEVNLNLMLDESASNAERRWQRVLLALGKPKDTEWTGDPYALTRTLTFDTNNKASILSCIISARENSRHVREQISTEQWHRLNRLYLRVTGPQLQIALQAEALHSNELPAEFLQQVMEAVHQFQGVTDSTMSHGEGWQFIQVGRYIERASATALLLEAYHEDLWSHPDRIPEANEYLGWMGLLRSATAFEAYCKVYTADLTPEQILEFLLLDPDFPHSLRFSIDSLQNALEAIHGEAGKVRAEPLRRLAGRLQASLSYSSVDEILNGDVIAYLRGIQAQCRDIHSTIYELYVDYSIQAALAG